MYDKACYVRCFSTDVSIWLILSFVRFLNDCFYALTSFLRYTSSSICIVEFSTDHFSGAGTAVGLFLCLCVSLDDKFRTE